MVKLSKRMSAVASMVTPGNVLADIGTDHGYVPIALIQKGKIPRAIAMDINSGPLMRANEHITKCRLEEYIQTRLSDGVDALKVGEADSILIAGMGGDLVVHILQDGKSVCRAAKELILQPQSELKKVRKFLRDHNYKIVDEDMILEDGKYYPMMKVIPVELDNFWINKPEDIIEPCDMYGPLLLKNGNPILRKFLVKQHKQLNGILDGLKNQPDSENIIKRRNEVLEALSINESAYTILGEIKDAGI
uniref:tRNA (adenine(22)-N(1))-methyltransferase n=1 Tax=Agathobacter sp. TaxID=2021311 RepID=UPI0040577867